MNQPKVVMIATSRKDCIHNASSTQQLWLMCAGLPTTRGAMGVGCPFCLLFGQTKSESPKAPIINKKKNLNRQNPFY
jgi:hypothetical protein